MSVTIVTCPRCNAQFKLRNLNLAGKKIKCRNCQSPFQVAMPEDEREDDFVDDVTEDDDVNETEFEEESQAPAPRHATRQPRPLGKPLGAKKPVKKKKTEVEEEEEEDASDDGSQKKMVFAVIGVGAVVAVGGIIFAVMKLIGGGGGATIEVPQKFVLYNEPTSALIFEYPEGWEAKHGGGTGGKPPFIKIKKGDITIEARDSVVGQSLGVLSNPSGAAQDGQTADELDPVHGIHIYRLEQILITEPDYKEKPPEVFQTKMGEARISEFIRPHTLSSTYGYRASMPPGTRQFNVTCECSKAEFEVLKETFRKIIASMTYGSGA